MGKKKSFYERLVEGDKEVIDNLRKPYIFLVGGGKEDLGELADMMNILAVKHGYRLVNQSLDSNTKQVLVCMEKKEH